MSMESTLPLGPSGSGSEAALSKEEWRDVPGLGGHFQASSRGRVRSKRRVVVRKGSFGRDVTYVYRARILRPHLYRPRPGRGTSRYKMVGVGWDNRSHSIPVHTMVLLAFHGPRPEGMVACHNNSNSLDNRPSNLRWDTHAGNMADRHRLGRYAKGEEHPMNKFSDARLAELISMRCCDAMRAGISKTHYYRAKRQKEGKP